MIQTHQTNAQSITVIIDGQPRTMAIEAVRERFLALAREVMSAGDEETSAKGRHLRRQVAFGAFVIQVRPQVEGMFLRWLGEAKFGHFQKVYAAIALAEKFATADGLLDEKALRAAIERYNAGAEELGYKAIDVEAQSVRAAQVAGGMRTGNPIVRNVAGSGAPESSDLVGGRLHGVYPAHAAHGGAPGADVRNVAGSGAPEFCGDGEDDGIESYSNETFAEFYREHLAAGGTSMGPEADARARRMGIIGTATQSREPETRSLTLGARQGGGATAAATQLTLDADYAIAERMRVVAGMVEGGGLHGDQRERLLALLGEIEQTNQTSTNLTSVDAARD